MILRFARHGQPALADMPKGLDYELPAGDYVLTPKGREQARCLGKHLKSIGFNGLIISSPYARTAETADVVAGECNLKFYLEWRIQERRFYPDQTCPGMTLEELHRYYKNLADDAEMEYPWMIKELEELSDVRARVDSFVAELIADPPAEDILLLGHGASLQSLKWNFFERCGYTGKDNHNWNCSISSFEVNPDGSAKMLELARFDFMPLDLVTSNKRSYGDPECV